MGKARMWILGAAAAMAVLLIGGWMLGVSPLLTQVTAANAQTASIQSSNTNTEAQLATLKTQYASISTLQDQLDALRLSVPEQEAASAFLNEVNATAAATGVTVQTVSIDSATLYSGGAAATATTGTTTSTATPAPVATTGATATPTVTSNGLVLIPVNVTVAGSFSDDQAFVTQLQSGARLLSSSGMTMSKDPTAGGLQASVIGDIFTLQGSSDSATTTTPSDSSTATPYPSDTTTPTPTSTPTPTGTAASSTTTGGTKSGGTSSGGTKKSTPPPSVPTPASTGS